MDEYSEVLGMTPREHERRMRTWYVLLAIVCFFAVFGEGILVLLSRREGAGKPGAAPAVPATPAPTPPAPPPAAPPAGDARAEPNARVR